MSSKYNRKRVNRSRVVKQDPWVGLKNQFRGAVTHHSRQRGVVTRRSGPIRDKLSSYRDIAHPDSYEKLISWLSGYPQQVGKIFPDHNLRNYQGILYKKSLGDLPLEQEILWNCIFLKKRAKEISGFVEDRRAISRRFLSSSQERIENSIVFHKKKFGLSLWILQLEIATKHHFYGLEAQKKFIQEIRRKNTGNLAPYIAWHTSARNEDSVTSHSFNNRYRKTLDESSIPDSLKDYLKFKISNEIPSKPDRLGNIVRVEYSGSLYDSYETLVRLLQYIAVNDVDVDRQFLSKQCLPHLNKIEDPRLKKVQYLLTFNEEYLRGFEKYTEKDYVKCYAGIEVCSVDSISIDDPNSIFAESLYQSTLSKSVSSDNDDTFIGNIVSHLSNIGRMENDCVESKNIVEKICQNFIGLDFGRYLYDGKSEEIGLPIGDRSALFLNSETLNPIDIYSLPTKFKDYIQYYYGQIFKGDKFFEWVTCEVDLNNYPSEIQILFNISKLFKQGKYRECISLSESLQGLTDSDYYRNQSERYEMMSVLKLGDKESAIRRCAEVCCRSPEMIPLLPVKEMIIGNDWGFYKGMLDKIYVPIVLHIYTSSYEDERQSEYLRDVWDEFILSKGCAKASELDESGFSLNELIYFLDNVCSPSIMDISIEFDSSSDIERERMAICYKLSEIDRDNVEDYQVEIKEITKDLEIRKGIREIDSSRVHVSTEPLRVLARRELIDLFNRYKKLSISEIDKDDDFEQAISDFTNKRKPLPEQYMTLPKNEANNLLIEIFDTIKDEFLNNGHHGLDSFLSMRIRHGTLEGFLTSPLEEHYFDFKIGDDSQYSGSDYWLNNIRNLSTDQRALIADGVSCFSEAHGKLISNLAYERLQIKSDEKPDGIFDIIITAYSCRLVAHWLEDQFDFDELYDLCSEILWTLLNPSLNKARELFSVEAKQSIEDNIGSLKKLFSNVLSEDQIQSSNVIGAINNFSIDVQTVIDKIGNWFNLTESSSFNDVYDLDTVVDIAILQVKNVNRGFEPNISKDILFEEPLHSQSMHNITDVLFILFDNVYKHSGVEEPWIKLVASLSDDDSHMFIEVEGQVNSAAKTDKAVESLDKIRKDISENRIHQKIKSEGRSGMYKLSKFASAEDEGSLVFGFTDEGSFKTSIKLHFVIKEAEKINRFRQQELGL